jgi:hypothetical protein
MRPIDLVAGAASDIPAERRRAFRRPHQQRPVSVEDVDDETVVEAQTVEQPLEVNQDDRPRHDTGEGAFRRLDSTAHADDLAPRHAGTGRTRQKQTRLRIGTQGLKLGQIAQIELRRQVRVARHSDVAVDVRDGDRTQARLQRRDIEQG